MCVVSAPGGEYVLALTAPRESIPLVSLFRSTWITSSIQALKKRGVYDQYTSLISAADRDAILYCSPASWLDAALVVRHYEACDRLQLSTETVLDIGADVTRRAQAPSLALGRSIATAASVTPWTILTRMDKLWTRGAVGGGIAVAKLGPKEARVEIFGFPVAHIRYNRVATRGILRGVVAAFCSAAWVHEVASLCARTTLGYRVQWA